jgi:hypothetical protein
MTPTLKLDGIFNGSSTAGNNTERVNAVMTSIKLDAPIVKEKTFSHLVGFSSLFWEDRNKSRRKVCIIKTGSKVKVTVHRFVNEFPEKQMDKTLTMARNRTEALVGLEKMT